MLRLYGNTIAHNVTHNHIPNAVAYTEPDAIADNRIANNDDRVTNNFIPNTFTNNHCTVCVTNGVS